MTPWYMARLAGLDLETSGKDPHEAFIVSYCVALTGGGHDLWVRDVVLSPGDRDIPAEASAVHHITTEHAREYGLDHRESVDSVASFVAGALAKGIPVVAHNAAYDLSVIEAECRREELPTIAERLGGSLVPVIDSMVLDKHCAPFRRRVSEDQGPYQLRTTSEMYGLGWDEDLAHGSRYDAMQALQSAIRIGWIAHTPEYLRPDWVRELRTQRFDDLAGVSAVDLHALQVRWAAEDAAGLQDWFRNKAPDGKRDPEAVVDGAWPLKSPAP